MSSSIIYVKFLMINLRNLLKVFFLSYDYVVLGLIIERGGVYK